uniref:YdbL family protein n=1 Tax=uncultured Sphingomonas sp. TaxID=158754 RepID=UPI0035CC1E90
MKRSFATLVTAFALVTASSAAFAQRDPAYQAARAAGQVGEQPDGYLGVVGAGNASVHALVNNINIQRKAAYTRQSASSGATVEQFAFTSGCNLILQSAPGEKYKGPDGSWKTRSAAAPDRDSRCI